MVDVHVLTRREPEDMVIDHVHAIRAEEPGVFRDWTAECRLEIDDVLDRVCRRNPLRLERVGHVVALQLARLVHQRRSAVEISAARLGDHVHVEAADADLRRRARRLDLDLVEAVVVEVEHRVVAGAAGPVHAQAVDAVILLRRRAVDGERALLRALRAADVVAVGDGAGDLFGQDPDVATGGDVVEQTLVQGRRDERALAVDDG